MMFLIKKIDNWVSVGENKAVSKTEFPFGYRAVVINGNKLKFCKGVAL